jgi:hypothetical protein
MEKITMATEVKILVTLQVDEDDGLDVNRAELEKSCAAAIKDAIEFGVGQGLRHPLAEKTSIGLVDVEPLDIQIIANVSGGVVQAIYCNECDVNVKINDRDVAEECENRDEIIATMDAEEAKLNEVG